MKRKEGEKMKKIVISVLMVCLVFGFAEAVLAYIDIVPGPFNVDIGKVRGPEFEKCYHYSRVKIVHADEPFKIIITGSNEAGDTYCDLVRQETKADGSGLGRYDKLNTDFEMNFWVRKKMFWHGRWRWGPWRIARVVIGSSRCQTILPSTLHFPTLREMEVAVGGFIRVDGPDANFKPGKHWNDSPDAGRYQSKIIITYVKGL